MSKVRLSKSEWEYDEAKPLGAPGGFGAVFAGRGESGAAVAVKRLHLKTAQYANRELEIAEYLLGHDHPHVIPILDVGRDDASDQYFIVMALADSSLQDLIERAAPLAEHEALEIIGAVAAGLDEIDSLVHRDLKPGNVLSHNGVWKLADLGLARFIEDTTSVHTMKGFVSAPYAAPEQWRLERATKATDVYALGCIIYALVTGRPPFPGPTREDFGQQHLHAAPPPLPASPLLRQIATTCLSKSPQLRPSIQSLRAQILRASLAAGTPTPNPLADVAATLAEREAFREAEEVLKVKAAEDRKAAAHEAVARLNSILEGLFEAVQVVAPKAERRDYVTMRQEGRSIKVGEGVLAHGILFPYLERRSFGGLNWDVLAGATISVGYAGWTPSKIIGRCANLWFGKLATDEGHRWWEVSYSYSPERARLLRTASMPVSNLDSQLTPFALYPSRKIWESSLDQYHISPGSFVLATNPRPVDGEYVEDFYRRWMGWLAKAAVYDTGRSDNFFESPPANEQIEAKFLG